MRAPMFEMRYFQTYWIAYEISEVFVDPFASMGLLNDWGGDENAVQFVASFPRTTRLHGLIEFLVLELFDKWKGSEVSEVLNSNVKTRPWIEAAMRKHGLAPDTFRQWLRDAGIARNAATEDNLDEYYRYLLDGEPVSGMVGQIVEETFFLLFLNREFLSRFNAYCSLLLKGVPLDDLEPRERRLISDDRVLYRRRIPVWARRAVYYRDRGACVSCGVDLTGLVSLRSEKCFDHIVSLAERGMNDVTNIQLLCDRCNRRKGQSSLAFRKYERWY